MIKLCKPNTTTIATADLNHLYQNLVLVRSPQTIINKPLGPLFAGFFSLSQSSTTTIQKLDFGTVNHCIQVSKHIRIPYLELVQTLAKRMDKIGFATVLLKLTIKSNLPVVDSSTGKRINISHLAPKLLLSPLGVPQAIKEIPVHEIPLTIQLFVFKTDNILNNSVSGQFIIGFALITDYTGSTTSYSVTYDLISHNLLDQFGSALFQATFIQYCNYYVLEYDSPSKSNIKVFQIVPKPPTLTSITRQDNVTTITGENLDLVTSVLIDDAPSTIISASDNEITLTSSSLGTATVNTLSGSVSGLPPVIINIKPNSWSGTSSRNIVIVGQNFTPNASVTFGQQTANIVALIETQIVAELPLNAVSTVVDVTVSNGLGPSNSVPFIYTLIFPDIATRGQQITIKGINFTGTTEVLLQTTRTGVTFPFTNVQVLNDTTITANIPVYPDSETQQTVVIIKAPSGDLFGVLTVTS